MVKLLLWNIDLTPDLSLSSPFRDAKDRYPKIAEAIKEYDIVVLNEAFLYRQKFLQLVSTRFKHIYTDKKPWYKFFNSGVVILSIFPFTDVSYHHYRHNSYWDLFISKGVLKVTFDIEGKKFDLYGTHMQQYNNTEAQYNRRQQVIELINFVNNTDSKGDIILVGDLNMGPTKDKSFVQHAVYYSNSEDAKCRNEQYSILISELNLKDLVTEEEICHLCYRCQELNVRRLNIPDNNLSDTGAFCIEF